MARTSCPCRGWARCPTPPWACRTGRQSGGDDRLIDQRRVDAAWLPVALRRRWPPRWRFRFEVSEGYPGCGALRRRGSHAGDREPDHGVRDASRNRTPGHPARSAGAGGAGPPPRPGLRGTASGRPGTRLPSSRVRSGGSAPGGLPVSRGPTRPSSALAGPLPRRPGSPGPTWAGRHGRPRRPAPAGFAPGSGGSRTDLLPPGWSRAVPPVRQPRADEPLQPACTFCPTADGRMDRPRG